MYRKTSALHQGNITEYGGHSQEAQDIEAEGIPEMSAYIAPTIEEQQQIGEYFRQMDRLIEIEKEELEKIKHIKSACMEKMFV